MNEPPSDPLQLSAVEARILGCLMEKQRTTPANYPLTLNSLVLACNQKSSREPVMNLYEGDVGHVVNRLRDRGLIKIGGLTRVERYHHKLSEALQLDEQAQAVMCVLMLRGAQTRSEIRTHTARLADFEDGDALSLTLMELSERDPPLVKRYDPMPGQREERFAHLLCGEPDPVALQGAARSARAEPTAAEAGSRIDELEQRLQELERKVESLLSGGAPD